MRMILILALVLVNSTAFAKRALVYNGPGACSDGCYQAAFQVALQAGLDPIYVGASQLTNASTLDEEKELFKDVVIWIQPGGKSKTAMTSITPRLKTAIQNFVRAGGAYVGFCAGAFASTEYVGTTNTLGFGFMPGNTTLYPDPNTNDADILTMNWGGKTRQIYWEGGPYFSNIPNGEAEAMASYPDGSISAARTTYGLGKVYVTGAHPEAPQDWRDYYGLKDSDGMDQDLAVEMINWAIAK